VKKPDWSGLVAELRSKILVLDSGLTDVDLDDYFRHEFHLQGRREWPGAIEPIEFWDVERWQDLRWR
jgi:hypothetical protein